MSKRMLTIVFAPIISMIFLLSMSNIVFTKVFADDTVSSDNAQNSTVEDQGWFLQNSIINEINTMNFTLKNVEGTVVSLQRYENENWNNLHEQQFDQDDTGKQFVTVDIKAPAEKGVIQYRLTQSENILAEFDVVNHDPIDYTDYEYTAYETVKEYCGNTYITTGDYEAMSEKKVVGLAHTDKNMIEIKSGMDPETFEWAIWHECAHILQHRAYDNNRADYPIEEKRSILWLNDELSPHYNPMDNNERGTGFSEKNANCIADYFLDPSNFGCTGNKRQAAYNIISGNPASTMVIDEHFSDRVRMSETGHAISEAHCSTETYCEQEFENGSAMWKMENGKETLDFTARNDMVYPDGHFFHPSLFNDYGMKATEGFDEVMENSSSSK